jgi:hypothetical protein
LRDAPTVSSSFTIPASMAAAMTRDQTNNSSAESSRRVTAGISDNTSDGKPESFLERRLKLVENLFGRNGPHPDVIYFLVTTLRLSEPRGVNVRICRLEFLPQHPQEQLLVGGVQSSDFVL